ncbi:MAG: nucleotide 5'-monophosphate nucleosidase PpnN [Halioglobus sp.]
MPYAVIRPLQSLDLLSQREMTSLATTDQEIHKLFRRCALAVLNTGDDTDDASELFSRYEDFEIRVVPEYRGLKLEIENAPSQAFVDGRMITGIRAHLFAALRDIVYIHHKLVQQLRFDLESREGISDAVFRILRNADAVKSDGKPRLVVCWGGHSISRAEYDFTKQVGYELGLRDFDIATGCGPGAMKGPMKGAAIGHAKQLNTERRYIGISEPGIITAESPNPIVNELVIMPDIEKRLEAFVRLAHGIVVFPGGVGTAEEILYLLCLKMHPANADIPLPVIMAAPESSASYFHQLDEFLCSTLGEQVREHYEIVVGDPAGVARKLKRAIKGVRKRRIEQQESFSFNWGLQVDDELQQPFHVTHETMASLNLSSDQQPHALAAALRRAFSGLVAGNVKDFGIRAIAERGPFLLQGEQALMNRMGALLEQFVADGRMKIDPADYVPCFELQVRR